MISQEVFVILAIAVGLLGFYPYLRDIYQKKTLPHSITWLIWAITQGTATAGLWAGGGGIGAINHSIGTCLVVFVFILSLFDGNNDIKKSDLAVLIMALSGMITWYFLQSPVLAVAIVTGVDCIGYLPTYRKTWSKPWSETISAWSLFTLSNVFTLMAMENFNFLTVGFISVVTCANIILISIMIIRRKSVKENVVID